MVGGHKNCTPGKRGNFCFREFFSRALLSERLGQTTNTEESRLAKNKKKEDSQSL